MNWKLIIIQFFITFLLFYGESLIHYNVGRNKTNKVKKICFPNLSENLIMIGTTMLFSFLAAVMTNLIAKHFTKKK